MSDNTLHAIIHGASIAAGAAGAGLAQIPGSDNLVITPIQLSMITALGLLHGDEVTKQGAVAILAQVSARCYWAYHLTTSCRLDTRIWKCFKCGNCCFNN